ncbi:hypothetical protein V8D89_015694 [Ganoderma adspersum]
MHDDYDSDGSLSHEEASDVDSEDSEDGYETQCEDNSDECCSCDDEATEAAPWDIPPPTSPEDNSPALRRSTRARQPTRPFAPPSLPKKDKGKGKAVAREALPSPPSRRTSTKRARSPSPASKRPRRDRRSDAETQELTVIPTGARTEFPTLRATSAYLTLLDPHHSRGGPKLEPCLLRVSIKPVDLVLR